MELNKNMYIGLANGVLMYLTKGKYNLLSEIEKEEERYYRFFTVNKTGRDIVMNITGKSTVTELEHKFCLDNGIDLKENEDWLDEFILLLLEKGTVVLQDVPIEQGELEIAGDGQMISPMMATVEVTEKCNLRCKHCYLDASCEKTSIISFDQFKDLVDIFKKNHVLNLELTGGELFVNPEAYEILELALKQFAMVAILTNGTILSDKVLTLLSKYKEKIIINVSIDSADPEVHDKFRGMKGAFEKSCTNIKRMAEAGITVRVASSIFNENMWEIDKLADLSISLGAKMFVFNFVEDFGRGTKMDKGDKVEDNLDAAAYIKYINDIIEKYKDIIPIVKGEDHILGTQNCGSAVNSIMVGADGNIRPCALFPKMNLFGNIFEEDFEEIFKKDIYRRISQILPPSEENGCDKKCRYYANCKGCYLKGLEHNRNTKDPCEWIKKNKLEDMLKIYERGFCSCLA